MKRSISLLSFFLHFIWINSLLLLSAAADEEKVAVLDGFGHPVEVGSQYYIKSAGTNDGTGGGGGLKLGYTSNQSCRLTVVQEIFHVENGIPCSFHPPNPEESVVRVSSSLNIKFEKYKGCAESTVWQVGEFNEAERFVPIVIDGKQGEPGCDTFRNWFKIEKGNNDGSYKLVSDPADVCSIPIAAHDIGIFVREGLYWPLTLFNGSALEVKFWKHHDETDSHVITI